MNKIVYKHRGRGWGSPLYGVVNA